jgi:hypothetical protein
MQQLTRVEFKTATLEREDGYWKVVGTAAPPKWEEPFIGRIKIPDNLSTFYVVAELARLFGEHSVTYFNYLPPKLREMLRTSTDTVVHTMYRDENDQQVELRIVEKPDYSMRASLMFTDYRSRKKRTSVPMSDLRLFAFKEFIKPDIKRTVLVDRDGQFIVFGKNDDGSITVLNPYNEKFTLIPYHRAVVTASLMTLLGEQVRYWEFVNNVRRDAVETVLDDLAGRKEDLEKFLRECSSEDKRCSKILSIIEDAGEDWIDVLKDEASARPRLVEPILEFAVKNGASPRAERLFTALETAREVWRKRVKAIRPFKLVIPEYDREEPAVSFWNDYSKEIPRPRMRFGRYYLKESVQNPIPVLFLLSVFEGD